MIARLVREFHVRFNLPRNYDRINLGDDALNDLRMQLIEEEYLELVHAVLAVNPDPLEVADALGDLTYVVYGAALAWGINLEDVVGEIHRSNMTKLGEDGKPVYREDGKVLKGPNFEEPNLAPILFCA